MSKNSPQRIHTEEPKPGSAVLACLYSQTSIAKHPVIRHFGITQRVAFYGLYPGNRPGPHSVFNVPVC